ncbi:MAG: glyoxylate/hydroxypyruvate reductase A [Acetobacter sp.]|jgi:glyoxylate/hydroxypyruvate reductase A|nr:glyoxylate/hydroxypyruvate reductase A [Acetobacter sp.]MCH4061435.1 glyoxylate/hydroxypyruvate reductase A [Acetobacter sp.]MCI1294067.1 glyoxylate/hydroxypyruvate reductase A [Acetobacter sp.]MCI1320714.1 glyoxylate/hydroxypyruvate reductase A [Acetobacter sp.]MCI1374014.1 glyoxylate/hydroxypyruvate reductase A [Acetobacter sp.]
MSFVLKIERGSIELWQHQFAELMPEMSLHIWPDYGDPADVEYIAMWTPVPDVVAKFPNLKLIFSLGAGVDQFDLSSLPPHIGLVRMIEPGLTAGMVEYVVAQVLSVHRDLPLYMQQQRECVWKVWPERVAAHTRVGIMGLGALGIPCAKAIASLGFITSGWNRSPRDIEGVTVFAGAEQRDAFLHQCDIVVCLLPLTDETRGMFNAELFAKLPKGASLINAGRGPQVVASDLLAALESEQLSWAVLDVTVPEPLPAEDALWKHPRVVITPHIASMTQPDSAVTSIIANIRRHQAGEALVGLVDRSRHY